MTTLRQTLEMALDAMKDFDYDKRMAAIEAVEQAIKDAEKQEPVAWRIYGQHIDTYPFTENPDYAKKYNGVPLYAAPPQKEWVGLTDDEIEAIADTIPIDEMVGPTTWHIKLSRAIEAKLKEKNT